jgi:hypothetical protein
VRYQGLAAVTQVSEFQPICAVSRGSKGTALCAVVDQWLRFFSTSPWRRGAPDFQCAVLNAPDKKRFFAKNYCLQILIDKFHCPSV